MWFVSEREYFERVLQERDRTYKERFESQEKALALALHAIEKRLEGMNEFRAALSDAQARNVTREETNLRFDAVNVRQQEMREESAESQGRGQGLHDGWKYLLGALGAWVAIEGLAKAHLP